MAQISDLESFKGYIMESLGAPVITIELAEKQVENIIRDSVEDFQHYHYGEGSVEQYMQFTISAGVNEYDMSGEDIQDVIQYLTGGTGSGINTLFSPINMMTGGIIRMDSGNGSEGFNISDYTMMMMRLQDIQDTFSYKFTTDFLPTQQILRMTPTPTDNGLGLLHIYKKENEIKLYNIRLVQQLAVARCKYLWGQIISKTSITLPGGATINGSEIKSEGKEEMEQVLQQIKDESEAIDFFVG